MHNNVHTTFSQKCDCSSGTLGAELSTWVYPSEQFSAWVYETLSLYYDKCFYTRFVKAFSFCFCTGNMYWYILLHHKADKISLQGLLFCSNIKTKNLGFVFGAGEGYGSLFLVGCSPFTHTHARPALANKMQKYIDHQLIRSMCNWFKTNTRISWFNILHSWFFLKRKYLLLRSLFLSKTIVQKSTLRDLFSNV